jgi:hypothetical protein
LLSQIPEVQSEFTEQVTLLLLQIPLEQVYPAQQSVSLLHIPPEATQGSTQRLLVQIPVEQVAPVSQEQPMPLPQEHVPLIQRSLEQSLLAVHGSPLEPKPGLVTLLTSIVHKLLLQTIFPLLSHLPSKQLQHCPSFSQYGVMFPLSPSLSA